MRTCPDGSPLQGAYDRVMSSSALSRTPSIFEPLPAPEEIQSPPLHGPDTTYVRRSTPAAVLLRRHAPPPVMQRPAVRRADPREWERYLRLPLATGRGEVAEGFPPPITAALAKVLAIHAQHLDAERRRDSRTQD